MKYSAIFRRPFKVEARTCALAWLALTGVALLTAADSVAAQTTLGNSLTSNSVLANAYSLLEKNNTHEAEKNLREYLIKDSRSADAHFLLGLVLFKETQAKESLAEYTEGAKYRQPSSYDLEIVALDYILLRDYMDADKWLTASLQSSPENAQGWYYLGRTKYKENRFEEAISAFQQCLRMDSHSVKAEDNLGLAYAGLGRNEEAAAAYRQAISWEAQDLEKNPGPYVDLGSLLFDEDRASQAIEYLRTAVTIAAGDSHAHAQLGKAYERLSQLDQARSELEMAVQLTPHDAALNFVLGRVYRRLGMMEKARAEFERSSQLNASPAQVSQASVLPH